MVKRLTAACEIGELKPFHSTPLIEQISLAENESDTKAGNHDHLSAFLHQQTLLIGVYRLLRPRRQTWTLCDYRDYIYHGPNFYLPHKLERAMTTFHDISIFTCPEYHPKDRVHHVERSLHESLDSVKLILTVPDFSRSEIIYLLNYPAERIITTKLVCSGDYIPRSPTECLPVLQKYQLAWQAYTLYIGTMEPRKNTRGLLHAYQLLPMKIRTHYPLILSDYRDWEDDVLWQLVGRGTREGWIRYLRCVPDGDLPYLYAAARAFVYPSFHEGFDLSILEAMSYGVLVVCPSVTSLPEVVGDAGPVVDHNDIGTISVQILQSLQNDSWQEIVTTRGLTQAKQFPWESCAT